jgi:lipoprotein-anchoring transpeptidase ErfK/SrfK
MRNFLSVPLLLACLFTGTAFGQYSVQIDLSDQKAYLLYNGRAVMESPVCSGRSSHATPSGNFQVMQKDLNHVSSIYGKIVDHYGQTVVADADVDMRKPLGTRFVNAPMHYFIQFAPGIGMHAGYLPGYPASHGCVRLPQEKAIAFYQALSVGAPVVVFGSASENRRYEASNGDYRQRSYYDRYRRYYRAFPPPFQAFGW